VSGSGKIKHKRSEIKGDFIGRALEMIDESDFPLETVEYYWKTILLSIKTLR
jgi:hypothetical protein